VNLTERTAVELSVVEFDPALINDRFHTEGSGCLTGSHQWTADDAIDVTICGSHRLSLRLPEFIERRIKATEQQTGGVVGGTTMTNDVKHDVFLTGRG
jgi:hypothetical protein